MAELIEDLAEPIRAYRWWRMPGISYPYSSAWGISGDILYSTGHPVVWPVEGLAAACWNSPPCGHAPSPDKAHSVRTNNGYFWLKLVEFIENVWSVMMRRGWRGPDYFDIPPCGIYAFANRGLAFTRWRGDVFGEVLLGGKVYKHDLGYRAEKAKVSKIILTRKFENTIKDNKVILASERYGVPMEYIDQSTLLAEGHEYGRNRRAIQRGAASGASPLGVSRTGEGTFPDPF